MRRSSSWSKVSKLAMNSKRQRRERRCVLARLWHGAKGCESHRRVGELRISWTQLAACGFFRECPFQETESSVAELCALIPATARLSRGARCLLPQVLAWLGNHGRLPLGVAGVFSDKDMRPVKLALTQKRRERCYDAVVAVRLLALSRFLLCEKLQEVVERWIWRSGSVARKAVALQLLEGEGKEALGLRDLQLGLMARKSLADGLEALPRKRLRLVAEAQQLLQDENHKVRECVLYALGTSGPTAASPCAEAMVLCLEDDCADVRGQAARSLCLLASEAASDEHFNPTKIAKAVAPLMSHHHGQCVVDRAAEGLARLGDVSAPLVTEYLVDGEALERQAAVEVLRKLGEPGIHQAASLMSHSNPGVRRAALRIFQGSNCDVLTVLPGIDKDIGALMDDPDFRVRGVAALALCHLGPEATMPFASTLLSRFNMNPKAAELRDLLAALASLGRSASWASEAVRDCLWAEQWSVRRAAAETYGEIAGTFEAQRDEVTVTREAAVRLSKLLKDHVVDVAESAAKALGCLGFEGARHAQAIAHCLDDDFGLAEAALVSLLKLLGHECFATKEAAAAGIALHFKGGGQASPRARASLIEALLREAKSEERNVREESIQALGCLCAREQRPKWQYCILKEVMLALDDVQLSVKRSAIDALGRLNLPSEGVEQRESTLKMLLMSPSRQLQRYARQALERCSVSFREGEVLLALRSADVRKKGIATTMQHLFVCCIIFTCTYTFWRTCHFFFEMLGLMLGFVTALLSFCFAA
ncbi:unnamed protein product [Durusdinium trenchii]|uniref:Protein unc-45 homolog B n=1 Tax=Durusdinium trenchii TaxID=1381693 RepID=A0ABP0HLR0_9DINO